MEEGEGGEDGGGGGGGDGGGTEEWEESDRSNIHQRQPSTFQTASQIRRRGKAFPGRNLAKVVEK